MKKISTKQIIYVALFVALAAVMSQIFVPVPGGVPFTLQPWAINLAGLILGPKLGALSALIYITLGALGAPVFTPGPLGFIRIIGPWGGFLLMHPVMAYLSGFGAKKHIGLAVFFTGLGVFIGLTGGAVQFMLVNNITLGAAFAVAFIPFIPEAIMRTIITPVFAKIINSALAKSGVAIQD